MNSSSRRRAVTARLALMLAVLALPGCGRGGVPILPAEAEAQTAKAAETTAVPLGTPRTPPPVIVPPKRSFFLDPLL